MKSYSSIPILTIIIPFIATFIIGLINEKRENIKKFIVIIGTLTSFILTLLMIKPIFIDNKIIEYWMGGWEFIDGVKVGISLRIDSLSLFVGIIITLASFLSAIYSIAYMERDKGIGKYYMLFMLLSGSMIGFVFTGDLFNMYVMLEIMTISAIALTAFRNEKGKSLEGSFKYIVIGGLGSSFILLGTVLLYMETHSLNIVEISNKLLNSGELSKVSILAFSTLLVGYGVKSFMVPCHTWPPDAHMAAPSSISMILSGVMSKTGVYGLIRILFIIFSFSGNTNIGKLILYWGVLTMVVGVSMALMQNDFKRLLAFHSVSQLGYIIIAIGGSLIVSNNYSDILLAGGLLHMINHASFKCLLFLCAGGILYKCGTTNLDEVSGVGRNMKFTMGMFIIGALSISGIPPFNGFISKWLIYNGTFNLNMPIVTIACLIVSVMTLLSFIKVFHTIFLGIPSKKIEGDVKLSMKIPMGILAFLCLFIGIFWSSIIEYLIIPVINTLREVDIKLDITSPYDPISFLFLFFILLFVGIIFLWINSIKTYKYMDSVGDSKYESFTGGELDYGLKLDSHDIFWGMKYNFRIYFEKLRDSHSGVVNDYSMWVVLTLAFVLIFNFLVL